VNYSLINDYVQFFQCADWDISHSAMAPFTLDVRSVSK